MTKQPVNIDPSKLLGFRLLAGKNAAGAKIGNIKTLRPLGAKIGGKLSVRIRT